MFDHFENKTTELVGKIFKIKWNKDQCEKRNHMFAQVGPISIAFKGYKKYLHFFPLFIFPSFILYKFLMSLSNFKDIDEWKSYLSLFVLYVIIK